MAPLVPFQLNQRILTFCSTTFFSSYRIRSTEGTDDIFIVPELSLVLLLLKPLKLTPDHFFLHNYLNEFACGLAVLVNTSFQRYRKMEKVGKLFLGYISGPDGLFSCRSDLCNQLGLWMWMFYLFRVSSSFSGVFKQGDTLRIIDDCRPCSKLPAKEYCTRTAWIGTWN